MKKAKYLLLATLLTLFVKTTFSQTADSLGVFPNPFSDSTTIYFDIAQSDTITLKVYSRFGQLVKSFFDSTILSSGSYNLNLLGDSLNDGIYFIRLDIGSTKNIVKKVLKNSLTSIVVDNMTTDNFLVFPNPTNDLLTIPIKDKKIVSLTDLNGNLVKSFTTDQQLISLSDLPSGQYIITILTTKNGLITSQKIQKIK